MTKSPRFLIAGGGSLGCVYPGLSIARRLRDLIPAAEVTVAGDGRAIERHTVRSAGLRYFGVPRADRPRRLLSTPGYVARNTAGWCVANWLLREREIDLVISLGGHASGPVVRAAHAARLPYLLVEQNALPNTATRTLARHAAAVCLAHGETAPRLPLDSPWRVTGGVSRPGFEDAFALRPGHRPETVGDDGRPRLVVLGGVAGSTSLNEVVPRVAGRLGGALAGWQIVHQTGDGWLTKTEDRYRAAGVPAVVVSYVDELAHLARASDLIVCRPGGSTLAELAMAGLPAVLVPDGRRRDGSHAANARTAAERYGCPVVDDRGADFENRLTEALGRLATDAAGRDAIASRIVRDASPEASLAVATAACEALGLLTRPKVRLAA